MNKKTIKDIKVSGKKVLVRCDFNVPILDGAITDDNRISEALPTIQYLLDNGARVVLCSHLGRPKGEFNKKYSLKPVADRLNTYLCGRITFCNDVIGEDARQRVAALKNGEAVLLENLRFHAEEEKNDKEFCRSLSEFCDIYVNDAFGTAHRAHASTAGIVSYGFAKQAVAGFLMEKEIKFLSNVIKNPTHPFVAILGGAKVSDKIAVIENLLDKVDTLIIGGGMAYTFLAANGLKIGSSICDCDRLSLARDLLNQAKAKNVKILLPIDVRVTPVFPDPITKQVAFKEVSADKIPDNMMALDIGDKTAELFLDEIKKAATVVWNGPMGVFENPLFAQGTKSVAEAVAYSKAISVIGGGDSAAAVIGMGLADRISHVSTGGGASLEMLEGKQLPGIICLNDN